MEPREFGSLVCDLRDVDSALGDGRKRPAACETDTALVARRSLVSATDIPVGTTLSPDMCTALRPGTGLSPLLVQLVLGRVARLDIAAGTQLDGSMFEAL